MLARPRILWLAALCHLVVSSASAATLEVGPGRAFPTLALAAQAARSGDHVAIAAGEYLECAFWKADNLVIEGAGTAATTISDVACGGKAIFVLEGNNTTIRNLTLSRVRVGDGNGGGLRVEGSGVTVEKVVFFNNQTGIQVNSQPGSHVVIRDSAFIRNGACERSCIGALGVGDVASLRIESSRFEGTRFGHNISARARMTEIVGCTIADGETGTSSHLIDLGGAERVILRGNTLQKGLLTESRQAAIWITGRPDGENGEILVQDNRFQWDGPSRTTFVVNRSAIPALLSGNEVSGRVRLLLGFGRVE